MQYLGLAVIVALFGLIILLVAIRILANGRWLLGWLRGCLGMFVLALSVVVGLAAWDVSSYQPLPADKPVATLAFHADGPQRYRVELNTLSKMSRFTLEGDLWQLDMRVLEWKGLATLIGLEPGFRLAQVTGRYLAVEQQDRTRHPRVMLSESPAGVDLWLGVQRCQCAPLVIDAQLRRVSYLPTADGAEYAIELAPTGLLAKPLNAAAEQALKDW